VTSPLVTLIGLTAGIAIAIAVVRTLWPQRGAAAWTSAAAVVAAAALSVNVLPLLRDRLVELDAERTAYAGTIERLARQRCTLDASRPDLSPALDFARDQIPEDARYRVENTTVLPCIALDLQPRLPVDPDTFDPARDWTIFDLPTPAQLRRAAKDEGLPPAERRFLSTGSGLVLQRPEPAA